MTDQINLTELRQMRLKVKYVPPGGPEHHWPIIDVDDLLALIDTAEAAIALTFINLNITIEDEDDYERTYELAEPKALAHLRESLARYTTTEQP